MIVEPDFLTHWKTLMLINELGDRAAPTYVIALWAHCQNRRSDSFSNLAPNALKAICRFEGEASKLRSALERCGFLDVNGDAVVVHGWAETNAKLLANWTNGSTGGRPRKNPTGTQLKPTDNPTGTKTGIGLTQPKPIEKSRLDGESESAGAKRSKSPTQDLMAIVAAYPRREGLDEALALVAASLAEGDDYEAMLAGTRACAAVIRTLPSGHLNRYVPSAEKFFSKKRWKDDPETFRRQGNQSSGQGQMSLEDAQRSLGRRGISTTE